MVDLPHLELVVQSFEDVWAGALGDRAEMVKPVGDGVLYAMPSGAVVVSDAAHDEARDPSWSWRHLPCRELKGVGSVAAWEVTGAS